MNKVGIIRKIIIFIVLLVAISISLIWHLTSVAEFNKEIHYSYGKDNENDTYFDLVNRDLSTSSWVKRDYEYNGKIVDLTAITYDGTLYNKGSHLLNNWTLKVDINGDCFINQMWNGKLEIHQRKGAKEIIDVIDLANYKLEDIKFKYQYDGDLLIPLHKGDYFFYFPNEKFKETEIESGESITIGGIFYFLEDIDLSEYTLIYNYHKSYFEGPSFIVTISLMILFLLFIFAVIVEFFAVRKTKKEMEYKQRIEHAESEVKAKSSFLANMSHEIRTPINTVIGLDTMILRESKEDQTKKYAKEIKNASTMLLSLINGILDSSKLEAGKMELIPADYSLKQLIFDVRTMTKNLIEAKGLDYIFEIDNKLPEKLYGDEVRLKQIIINLLTNAGKYTEKGSVTLKLSGEMIEGKLKLKVAVIDTGMGIKKEDIELLTENYQRVNDIKTRTIEGTGLGLGLVKGLLALMDSKLEVESTFGKGSTFSFTVMQDVNSLDPIGELNFENSEVDEDEEYSSSFSAPDAKLLVVDDNSMNLMVFEQLLKDTNAKITKAQSGREALELTKNEEFDIIFMDHMMPEMDGIETFKKIKTQEGGKNCKTPVIVLTANALQGAKENYLHIGFNDFLQKPIEPGLLESKTLEHLPKDKIKAGGTKVVSSNGQSSLSSAQIEGVDIAYGLSHLGGEQGVLDVMKNFALLAEDDARELDSYYKRVILNNTDKDAIDAYRIKVHAMKTSAGLFGGLHVSGAAAFLEKAARENRIKEIITTTPFFIEYWMSLKVNVENFILTRSSDNIKKKEVNRKTLENLLHQLSTSMKAYDINTADSVMNEIEHFELNDDKEIVRSLKLAVSKLEAEKIDELCEELLRQN